MSTLKNLSLAVSSFEGNTNILGTSCNVIYMGGERKALVIEGVSVDDAIQIIKTLDAAKPTAKPAAAPPAKPAPKPVAKKEPEPEPDEDADLDLDGDTADADAAEPMDFDMEFLAAQTKLRPVLEHIYSKGFTTAAAMVEQATAIREHVPPLAGLDNFEKRIDRAVEVVLEGISKK